MCQGLVALLARSSLTGSSSMQVVLLTRGLTDREAKLAKATGDLVAENVASRQVP